MEKPKPKGYSALQIGLHWAVAGLIVIQFLAHDGIEHAWRAFDRSEPPAADDLRWAYLHIAFGYTIFVLALWRLWLRFTRGAPALPENEPAILKFVANATHVLIYVLIVGMPLSGGVAWFFGVGAAAAAHSLAKDALFVLVCLHIIGALAQQLSLIHI